MSLTDSTQNLHSVLHRMLRDGGDLGLAPPQHQHQMPLPGPITVSVGNHASPQQYQFQTQQQQNRSPPFQQPALTKERRSEQEMVDLLNRTVHVRFLPTNMRQGEFATLCNACGEVLRIRICGNNIPSADQSWIYGFVEFSTPDAAMQLVKKSGLTLGHNGKSSLRMKATLAKQPINDRVFHDADPSKGAPCTFGSGAFAGVTLKEAVESYFSLVTKNNVAKSLQTILGSGSVSQRRNMNGSSGSDSDDVQSVTPPQTPSLASESPSIVGSGLIFQQPPLPSSNFMLGSSGGSIFNGGVHVGPGVVPKQQQNITIGSNSVQQAAHQHYQGGAAAPPAAPSARPMPRVSVGQVVRACSAATPIIADEFVLQRCYMLLEAAMKNGRIFAQSKIQTSFFDGIASVRSLQEALESHKPFRTHLAAISASFASTVSDSVQTKIAASSFGKQQLDASTSQQPQPLRDHIARAVTEVFVSMNLIALCLHMLRGTLADLVPFANTIVEVCLALPSTNVVPRDLAAQKSPSQSAANSDRRPQRSNEADEDDDDEEDSIGFIMKVVHDAGAYDTVEAENDRLLLVRHQVFLCQSLMAVGLMIEAVNPLMARCVYNMAHLRMGQALNTTSSQLQSVLHSPVVSLRTTTILTAASAQGSVGSFGEYFFTSFTAGTIDGSNHSSSSSTSAPPQGSSDGSVHQTGRLPPAHCGIQVPVRR